MKKMFSVFALLMILCFTAAPVMAAGTLVNDEADVLTTEQEQELEAGLLEIAYADDYFDYNGYGRGDYFSGVIMVVDVPHDRRYISTCGDCIGAYTDEVISYIGSDLAESADARDYYGLSKKFASYAKDIMSSYRSNGHYAVPYSMELTTVAVILVVAFIIAFVIRGMAKSSTQEAVTPVDADIYAKDSSANIRVSKDMFLYSNVTRTARSQNKSGGSSTHTSSSGRTHGGGSF